MGSSGVCKVKADENPHASSTVLMKCVHLEQAFNSETYAWRKRLSLGLFNICTQYFITCTVTLNVRGSRPNSFRVAAFGEDLNTPNVLLQKA